MRRPSARAPRWPALLLVLIPGLLAPKGCYFGERDVPLGGNRDPSAGGQSADDADDTDDTGDATGSDATGSDATGASGNGGAGNARPGTEMRAPGVFQVH